VLDGFSVIGHVHWKVDITNGTALEKVLKIIKVCNKLNIREIVIHPTPCKGLTPQIVIKKNASALNYLANYCSNRKIQLLVENLPSRPFNSPGSILALLKDNPKLKVALDIGHVHIANRRLSSFFKSLGTKINHIHLHNNYEKIDHIIFDDIGKLRKLCKLLSQYNYDGSMTLEIYFIRKRKKRIRLSPSKRREIILQHVNALKEILR
jgi:sugar phosphate isomerase/epimerase